MVQIGDRLVDYNESFQLYLFSSSADLNLSSDQSVLLTIVNFTLNHIGLTEQVNKLCYNFSILLIYLHGFTYKYVINGIKTDLASTACT